MVLCSPTPGSVPETKTKTTPNFWHTGSSVFGVGDFRTWDGLPGEWRLHIGCGRGPLSTHMCDIVRMLCLCGSSGRWRFMGVKHTCGHNALISSHLVCLSVCLSTGPLNQYNVMKTVVVTWNIRTRLLFTVADPETGQGSRSSNYDRFCLEYKNYSLCRFGSKSSFVNLLKKITKWNLEAQR